MTFDRGHSGTTPQTGSTRRLEVLGAVWRTAASFAIQSQSKHGGEHMLCRRLSYFFILVWPKKTQGIALKVLQ